MSGPVGLGCDLGLPAEHLRFLVGGAGVAVLPVDFGEYAGDAPVVAGLVFGGVVSAAPGAGCGVCHGV